MVLRYTGALRRHQIYQTVMWGSKRRPQLTPRGYDGTIADTSHSLMELVPWVVTVSNGYQCSESGTSTTVT